MAEFKKGQLVAVKIPGATKWELRVFERVALTDEPFCGEVIVRRPENATGYCVCMESVCPAEEVWPNIFLSVEREITETLREQRDQHYRQLHWLCERLQTLGECPPDGRFRNCRLGCPKCWEMALQEAVEEEQC